MRQPDPVLFPSASKVALDGPAIAFHRQALANRFVWYVSDVPHFTARAYDWGWDTDRAKAVPLTRYWQGYKMLITDKDLSSGIPSPVPRGVREWVTMAAHVALWLALLFACGAIVWIAMWIPD